MNKDTRFSRRDFINITAISAGVLIAGKYLFNEEIITIKESRLLMGTIINLKLIVKDKTEGELAINQMFSEMERQILIMSHQDIRSALSKLNRNGYLNNPPDELVIVLEKANQISDLTNGSFDVTVKPLLDLYRNYYQTDDGVPHDEEIFNILEQINYKKVLVTDNRISFEEADMKVTLDGIAKGYIVDVGNDVLSGMGFENVMVEAGGDLLVAGMNDQESWKIGVLSPRQSDNQIIATVKVVNKALATSGDYMQPYTPDYKNHHIINPKTGYSSSQVASASVLAQSAMLADGLATALMVMNISDGISVIESLPNCEALLVKKDMTIIKSTGFDDFV